MNDSSVYQPNSYSARERRSSNEPREKSARLSTMIHDNSDTELSQRIVSTTSRSIDCEFLKIVKASLNVC